MKRKTIEKGHYGYVTSRQKTRLVYTILCAAAVAIIGLAGFVISGTKLNLLMVPAMLMVIPAANFFVAYVAVSKFSSGRPEQYEMLKAYQDQEMLICDLAVVNDKGARLFAEFAVVYKNGVVAYVSNQKWKPSDMEIHINDLLKRKGLPMRIKVYHDWNEFLERINGLEIPDDEAAERRVELAKEAVLSTCL